MFGITIGTEFGYSCGHAANTFAETNNKEIKIFFIFGFLRGERSAYDYAEHVSILRGAQGALSPCRFVVRMVGIEPTPLSGPAS